MDKLVKLVQNNVVLIVAGVAVYFLFIKKK